VSASLNRYSSMILVFSSFVKVMTICLLQSFLGQVSMSAAETADRTQSANNIIPEV
jgi:hypothetical protein